jgi:hypothetical protein
MAQANVWMHETVLPPVASSASEARDFVCLHLIEHQLLYLVEDIRLVASEFATIAMVRSQSSFTVMLQRVHDTVGLSVTEAPTPAAVRTRTHALEAVLRAVLAEALPVGDEPWHSRTQGLSMVQVGSKAWGGKTEPDGTRTMWASFAVRSRVP